MPNTNEIRINGQIIDGKTRQGVPGLRIEAWDQTQIIKEPIASAVTDSQGAFHITVAETHFGATDEPPDITFKVFQYDKAVKSTVRTDLNRMRRGGVPVTVEVDLPEIIKPGELHIEMRVVKGKITQKDGRPLVNATVRAFDKDLRREQELGNPLQPARTNSEGAYEIAYNRAQLCREDKEAADLFIRVYVPDEEQATESAIVFKAGSEEIIDLVAGGEIAAPRSEYELMMSGLSAFLSQVSLTELTAADITFLAGDTGFEYANIKTLSDATKIALQTELPTEIIYGLARKNVNITNTRFLLSQSIPALRSALEAALQEAIIPAQLRDQLPAILSRLKDLIVQQASEHSEIPGNISLGSLLSTAKLTAKQTKTLIGVLAEHEDDMEAMWAGLKDHADFSEAAHIDAAKFTLQLSVLTRNHLPLIQQLQQLREAGQITELCDFAAFGIDDWLALIRKPINGAPIGVPSDEPGANQQAKELSYAKTLFNQIEVTFPTPTVFHQIAKSSLPLKNDLFQFFKNVPDFNFATARLATFLSQPESYNRAFNGVQKPEETRLELLTVQRLFKVSPRVQHILALKEAGFYSAKSIAEVGPQTFIQRHGLALGGPKVAAEIHKGAASLSAYALSIWGKYAQALSRPSVAVIAEPPTKMKELPNYTQLFGSPDMCACKDCQSVYSPAAYLVELLEFLNNNSTATDLLMETKQDGLRVLLKFNRRPDIAEIKLSCENTNTPLPYIDLVNEILERAALGTLKDIDSVEPIGQYPQTTWSEEELAANPEHVIQTVYDSILSARVYPWNLPFDLNAAEARTYLKHLGTPRYKLMEVFYKSDHDELTILRDPIIAKEYLGCTDTEWVSLFNNQPPPNLFIPTWELWGLDEFYERYDDISRYYWYQVLSQCNSFLKRSGLEFSETLELLKLNYINPTRTAQHPGITCYPPDACKLDAVTLNYQPDIDFFRRVSLFVRLQRKLGWTAQELDHAITIFGTSDINHQLLLKVSHIQRLREKTNLPVIKILSWWGTICTKAEADNKPSLYERLFLNKSIVRPDQFKDEVSLFRALADTQMANKPQMISQHLPYITAALGISAEDVLHMLAWTPVLPETQLKLHISNTLINLGGHVADVDGLADAPHIDPPVNLYPVTIGILTLENLTRLYRISTFCKAFRLSLAELIALQGMTGIDPFDPEHTENTIIFVRKIDKVRSSPFKILELDYLLRNRVQSMEQAGASLQETTQILEQMRMGLQKIAVDTAVTPDPTGETTRKTLETLRWEGSIIDQVVVTLTDSIVYEAPLEKWPTQTLKELTGKPITGPLDSFNNHLVPRIAYDQQNKKLRFKGVITNQVKRVLLSLSSDTQYQEAIQVIYDQPRDFILANMKVFEMPLFQFPLEGWPEGLVLPDALKKVKFDAARKTLSSNIALKPHEVTDLLALTTNPHFQNAVSGIVEQIVQYLSNPVSNNTFLTANDLTPLLYDRLTSTDRFEYVLTKLLTYLRTKSSESFIKQHTAETLKLEPAIAERLLVQWVNAVQKNASGTSPQPAISAFLADELLQAGTLIRKTFPEQKKVESNCSLQYATQRRLQKIAVILTRLRVTFREAQNLFEHSKGWLNLQELPVQETLSCGLFSGWERLLDVCQLRDRMGGADPDLFALFELAGQQNPEQFIEEHLCPRMGWILEDVKALHHHLEIKNYEDEKPYLRLEACFKLGRRIGSSVTKPVKITDWVVEPLTAETARSIKQAAKAKYDYEQWLSIAKPLQNGLREQKRQALVSYLTGLWNWTPEQLYGHYLIDVEMAPCMMTSRIVQATNSVQLFVQRCLLGLEGVELNSEAIRQWNMWMKYYRVWEANRKVFVYPENYIEPELRDDKSEFFKEFESELLQNEITDEHVEQVYLHYLEKLDAVSQLEIMGLYVEAKDEFEMLKVLHVFGRTRNLPHIYYYRRRNEYFEWSAWEKIDADIEGNHLIPVIWNRRLHIFWPIITTSKESNNNFLSFNIRMAWSQRQSKKFSAKQITKSWLIPHWLELQRDPSDKGPIRRVVDDGSMYAGDTADADAAIRHARILSFDTYEAKATSGGDDKSLIIYCSSTNGRHLHGSFNFSGSTNYNNAFIDSHIHSNQNYPWSLYSRPYFRFNYVYQQQELEYECQFVAITDTQQLISKGELPEQGVFNRHESIKLFHNDKPGCVLLSHQSVLIWHYPFFYQNDIRSLFVDPFIKLFWPGAGEFFVPATVQSNFMQEPANWIYYFVHNFFHPYASKMIAEVQAKGVEGFLNPTKPLPGSEQVSFYRQGLSNAPPDYKPDPKVTFVEYEKGECISFEYLNAYASYNWEIFFHAPLLIADRLSKNQKFEAAHKWFQYIFDPTDVNPPDNLKQGAWKFGVFFDCLNAQESIQEVMKDLSGEQNKNQIEQWRHDPFKPHLLARLRTTPYMKTVVMKYLDNLLAWGDQLFRMNTRESINEATQLYVLATTLLGPRPRQLPAQQRKDIAYSQIKDIDAFQNPHVLIENEISGYYIGNIGLSDVDSKTSISNWNGLRLWDHIAKTQTFTTQLRSRSDTSADNANGEDIKPFGGELWGEDTDDNPITNDPNILYFCIPQNQKLVSYWDKVADRLFKIRHCMNIEGIVQDLPLFAPPIDPMLLVKAAAAGLDLSSVLNDLYAPLPSYHFTLMLQKAIELCNEVKTIGASLLTVLEKRDAEGLALMRSEHEIIILDLIRNVRKSQISEAAESKAALEKSKDVTNARYLFYKNIQQISDQENQFINFTNLANIMHTLGQESGMLSAVVTVTPDTYVGGIAAGMTTGPIALTRTPGGSSLGSALQYVAQAFGMIANSLTTFANISAYLGERNRRWDEWKLQEQLADLEIKQIDTQILAATIRKEIAEKELENHERQSENTKEVDDYLHSKFTNGDLYSWMIGQISTVYFQSYQLAYDIAKRAERCYRFELGLTDSDFIQFGYWDSLKKGLLAGEKLHFDLKRMEMSYLDQQKRQYEITKHISILQLNPGAFIALKELGTCEIELPEALFDMDYPGHYMRRIKSVSITIPCVVGPYTSINCTLTLLGNETRIKSIAGQRGYAKPEEGEDDRFVTNFAAMQSIATSHAQNDSGMFELNFRDERYLPFEGAGAISRWRIELPKDCNAFDFNSISDVILHLKYTAKEGGDTLRKEARDYLGKLLAGTEDKKYPLTRLFSLRHEFANEWQGFLKPKEAEAKGDQTITLIVNKERFPFLFQNRMITINNVELFFKVSAEPNKTDNLQILLQAGETQLIKTDETNKLAEWKDAKYNILSITKPITSQNVLDYVWTLTAWLPSGDQHVHFDADAIENVFLLCSYTIEKPKETD